MKSPLRIAAVSAFALLISLSAFAQSPEVSTLPITEPTDVGGTILQPGTYMIRVLRSFADRNKVQVTNADRSIVYVSALTVPHQLEPGEEVPNTMFVYYPAGEGMPRALRTWFAPNPVASQGGHDIIYEASRAQQLARLSKTNVVYYPTEVAVADIDTAPLEVVTPTASTETYTYTPPTTTTTVTEITNSPAPISTPEPMVSSSPEPVTQIAEADTEPAEMPHTASNLPLIALLGLASLGGAVAFRIARS